MWSIYEAETSQARYALWKLNTSVLQNSNVTSFTSPVVVIPPNTFSARKRYKIQIRAKLLRGVEGLVEYDRHVNSPPSNGSCDITPRAGHVFITRYTYKCSGWKDPDVPLSYQVSVVNEEDDGSGGESLLYYGKKDRETIILPLGNSKDDYYLTLVFRIQDKYNSVVASKKRVQVRVI